MPAQLAALPYQRGRFINQSHRDRMSRRVEVRARRSPGSAPVIFILALVFVGLPALSVWSSLNPSSETVAQSQPIPVAPVEPISGNWQDSVEPVFTPGYQLSTSQMEVYELLATVPNDPVKYGLDNLGLPVLGFTRAQQEALFALALSESQMLHTDETGGVLTSEAGCVGVMQGCNDMCLWEYWLARTTNVWCGAFTFRFYWNHYGVDENPLMLHYAFAAYKGAFLMEDTDWDGKKDTVVYDDTTGLPFVDPDLAWQVQLAESYLTWVPKPV